MGGAGEEVEGFYGDDVVFFGKDFQIAAEGCGVAGDIEDGFGAVIGDDGGCAFLQSLSWRIQDDGVAMGNFFQKIFQSIFGFADDVFCIEGIPFGIFFGQCDGVLYDLDTIEIGGG